MSDRTINIKEETKYLIKHYSGIFLDMSFLNKPKLTIFSHFYCNIFLPFLRYCVYETFRHYNQFKNKYRQLFS